MNFKKALSELGFKQKFIAKEINISPQRLCMYLNNTRPMPVSVLENLLNFIKKHS